MKRYNPAILITCEHGGNRIPSDYKNLVIAPENVLKSHRGWDQGALKIARSMAQRLDVPIIYSEVSRLLIDLNRSLHHRLLFSEFTTNCNKEARLQIIEQHYKPYRHKVDAFIKRTIGGNRPVLHLSIHSFTPELNGHVRNTDIGLLYDPARQREKEICRRIKTYITDTSDFKTRLNYPYRGTADGLTTALRKRFSGRNYAGIEIEINQKLAGASGTKLPAISKLLCSAIRAFCPD